MKRKPVVVFATSNAPKDVADCYDLGTNSYVRKSADLIEFADSVRQGGLYWLSINEPSIAA